jgi:hypothetical protein
LYPSQAPSSLLLHLYHISSLQHFLYFALPFSTEQLENCVSNIQIGSYYSLVKNILWLSFYVRAGTVMHLIGTVNREEDKKINIWIQKWTSKSSEDLGILFWKIHWYSTDIHKGSCHFL